MISLTDYTNELLSKVANNFTNENYNRELSSLTKHINGITGKSREVHYMISELLDRGSFDHTIKAIQAVGSAINAGIVLGILMREELENGVNKDPKQ